jgi:hypothetical protein
MWPGIVAGVDFFPRIVLKFTHAPAGGYTLERVKNGIFYT